MAEYTIVQVKRDSTLNWYASNPRLALGEPGVDMDLHRFKIGNGIDRWNELPYMDDDLYKLLDKQEQETADQVQALLNKIAANKLDADQKYNAVTSELRNTSRDLTGRMNAVESSQAEYQENLTERQQEFEEAVTGDFEDTKAEVQAGLDEFNETRDRLNTRMDAIVGQATEDTEILDARTDAEYRTYPNLGTNIRNIHRQLLDVKHAGEDAKSDIDEEIAGLKAADTGEQQARIQADEAHDSRLSELEDSAEKLFTKDTALQGQIDENAETILKTGLLLAGEIQRDREESARLDDNIATERNAREAGDAALSEKLDTERHERQTADNIERSERQALDDELKAADKSIDAELKHERLQRVENSEETHRRIDELSGAIIKGSLLLENEDNKLRTEKAERIKADADLSGIHRRCEEFLQEQAVETAGEVIGLNIRLYEEQQARMQADEGHEERLSELEDSAGKLFTKDTALQAQADENAETILKTAVTLGDEMLRTREEFARVDRQIAAEQQTREAKETELSTRLDTERRERVSEDEGISARIDAQGHELEHERRQRVDDSVELGRRIDKLLEAVTEGALLLSDESEKLRTEIAERIQAEEDLSRIHSRREEFLQEQAVETAGEVIGLNIRLYEEQQARREINAEHDARIEELSDDLSNTQSNLQAEVEQRKAQADSLSEAILGGVLEHVAEHERRERAEEELSERITQTSDELNERQNREELTREESIKRLDAEVKPFAEGLIREGLNRYEADSKLQIRIEHEESSSASREDFQNEQINELGSLGIQQAVRLYHERKERQADIQSVNERLSREGTTRAEIDQRITEKLEHEALLRETRDELLQEQLEQSARGLFGAAYEMYSAREKLNTDIEHESRSRIAGIDRIQEQTDELAGAVIAEAIRRRNDNHELRQKITDATAELEGLVADEMSLREGKDEELSGSIETVARQSKVRAEHLQEQADELAEAILKNLLNIVREAVKCQELDANIRAVIAETAERLEAADERETEQRQQRDTNHQTQVNDLAEAVLYTLLNGYRAREKIKARIRVIEEALIDAGVLDESDIPPATETEIDGMLEDIFSGNASDEEYIPVNDEDAEFISDIDQIFNP